MRRKVFQDALPQSLALGDKVLLAASMCRDSLPTISAPIQNPSPAASSRLGKERNRLPVPMPLPISSPPKRSPATCSLSFNGSFDGLCEKALKDLRRGTPPAERTRGEPEPPSISLLSFGLCFVGLLIHRAATKRIFVHRLPPSSLRQHRFPFTVAVPDLKIVCDLPMAAWDALSKFVISSAATFSASRPPVNGKPAPSKNLTSSPCASKLAAPSRFPTTFWDDPGRSARSLIPTTPSSNPAMCLFYVPDRRADLLGSLRNPVVGSVATARSIMRVLSFAERAWDVKHVPRFRSVTLPWKFPT